MVKQTQKHSRSSTNCQPLVISTTERAQRAAVHKVPIQRPPDDTFGQACRVNEFLEIEAGLNAQFMAHERHVSA